MLKQQEFSEMVGISTNYLSDVEKGKSSIRLDKLVLIMNELQCSADDLFMINRIGQTLSDQFDF